MGLGDRYLEMLEPWRQILKNGLTTWAETADPARSDCHAWGASPNFELLRTVAGIDSMAPGFARVGGAQLGQLTQVHARMPHPKGEIDVRLVKSGAQLTAGAVELPAGITGEFEWAGAKKALAAGKKSVSVVEQSERTAAARQV